MDANRAALRQAHAHRDAAVSQVDRAVEIHSSGLTLVETTASILASYKVDRDAAQNALSLRIAEHLRAGEITDLHSDELAFTEEEISETSMQHQAAQRAVERLAADVETAKRTLQAAQAKVREAAVNVLADEANRRASELRRARAIVVEHELWLKAARDLPLGEFGIALRPYVEIAMESPDFYMWQQVRPEATAQRRCQAYLVALDQDHTATWDAVADLPPPPPPMVGPGVVLA